MIFPRIARGGWTLALLLSIGVSHAVEPPAAAPPEAAPAKVEATKVEWLPVPSPVVKTYDILTVDQTADDTKAPAPARTKDGKLVWFTDLDAAHRQAQIEGEPVFVRVLAGWCPTCQAMEKAMNQDAVQAELARWVLVHIDVTSGPTRIRELQTGAVPAWFVRTAAGRPVASHIGGQTAEQIVAWLKENRKSALARPDDVLLAADAPDPSAVDRLVGQFDDRDTTVRQAAIRRLVPHPNAARPAVVKAFREGRLSARLSALEVLRRWRAPVEEMDPWLPDSFSQENLARLDEWVDESAKTPQTVDAASATSKTDEATAEPRPLSEEDLAEARAEIERLVKGTDFEALAAAARLATVGRALLPEVTQRLTKAETDHDLQRLRMLRYRLLASDLLALRWPGGLLRLADTDPSQRRKAAEELVHRATASDAALLLSLFGDSDPMVREIGLRGLQGMGGEETTAALGDLLSDPEPNIRAAVLKQLEEKPQASMVPKVTRYLKTETDPDLIVHAVRFLRVSNSGAAMKSLLPLLQHDVWQVRAEAAAAAGAIADSTTSEQKARIFAALVELLKDSDAFVVSRAVEGLAGQDLLVAVDPMIDAAERHPQLAVSIIETLTRHDRMRAKALPHLRKMFKHDDSRIRAAAISGLAKSMPSAMEKEALVALEDPAREVRIAAAELLFGLLEQKREAAQKQINDQQQARTQVVVRSEAPLFIATSQGPTLMESLAKAAASLARGKATNTEKVTAVPSAVGSPPSPSEKSDKAVLVVNTANTDSSGDASKKTTPDVQKPDDNALGEKKPGDKTEPAENDEEKPNAHDVWLAECYTGKHRPSWVADAKEPLLKMLESDDPKEKMAAAMALVPLGQLDLALPILSTLPRGNPETFAHSAKMLSWLVWEKRAQLFDSLLETANDPSDYSSLITGLITVADRRTTDRFWNLLSKEKLPKYLAGTLQHGLSQAYLGERYYNPSEASLSAKMTLRRDAKHWVVSGNEIQRMMALSLLATVAPDEAAEFAHRMIDDKSLAADHRRDAFRILLTTANKQRKAASTEIAVNALANDDQLRQIALAFLAGDTSSLQMSSAGYPLSYSFTFYSEGFSSGKPIVPKPPKGLEPKHVRPWIHDKDAKTAAYAGYLLALLGQPEGLPPLLDHWQSLSQRDWDDNRLVVRAIVALNDSTQVGTLRKIYGETDNWRRRELYWTIRVMTGPEILKLRKQIRDEVGMNSLR
ncbi:MAG: HEAT repeat domain-containing protein [Pirellulales bacterium]|nr:HEAT repeat domain-containing protein [Pirellulales bacterium]